MTYHWVCNKSNTTSDTSGAGTAYPSGVPDFTPGFVWGLRFSSFSFLGFLCVRVTKSKTFFVVLLDYYKSFCSLSFGHCIVCA
jgi:hypothetical protein